MSQKQNRNKKTPNLITTTIALLILVVLGWNQLAGKTEQPQFSDRSYTQQAGSEDYTFRSAKYREEHFEKHGDEFHYQSATEYESGASQVINNPEALHKQEAEDGDDVYYLEVSNEFVIVSTDGYIRTYFKPDDGINYFNRQ